jgi:PKD repeat protein
MVRSYRVFQACLVGANTEVWQPDRGCRNCASCPEEPCEDCLARCSADIEENHPPHAEFTAIPREGFTPLTVDFDGTKSTDPDGDQLAFYWVFSDRLETMDVPVFPLVFNDMGAIDVTLTVKDPGGLTDTITEQVFPYTKVSITGFDVKDAMEKTKTQASVNCTHPLIVTLQLFRAPSGQDQNMIFETDYECNSGYKEIGPELESGLYLLKATIKDTSLKCSRCTDQKYFTAMPKPPETNTPEMHPIAIILTVLVVLLVLNSPKKRDKK